MGSFIDLTGKTFNRLTVLYKLDKRGNEWYWHCQCECGNECDIAGVSLRSGRTKSCGCLKKETDRASKNNWDDLTGKKFGHLTAIERVESDKYGHAKWKCVCDCDAHTELIVYADNLKKGHTHSCGCERRSHGEVLIATLLTNNNIGFKQEYQAFKFSSGSWAKFDFYIDNKYFIEYDGETHYKANLHGWHDKKQLEAQLERDAIKNEWCKRNNIPLIRIPYTHLNDLCIEDLKLETTKFLVN